MKNKLFSLFVAALMSLGVTKAADASVITVDLVNGNDPGGNLFAFYNGGRNFILDETVDPAAQLTFDTMTGMGTLKATIVKEQGNTGNALPGATSLELFLKLQRSDTNADGLTYQNIDKYATFRILTGSYIEALENTDKSLNNRYSIMEKPIQPVPRGLEIGKTKENGPGEIEVEAWLKFTKQFSGSFCSSCGFNKSATSDIDLSIVGATPTTFEIIPAPVPNSLALLPLGAGALLVLRRRRAKK